MVINKIDCNERNRRAGKEIRKKMGEERDKEKEEIECERRRRRKRKGVEKVGE